MKRVGFIKEKLIQKNGDMVEGSLSGEVGI